MTSSDQQIHPEAAANITLATKARQVESWQGALAPDDPLGNAARLADYLAAHDRAGIAAAFRSQLLDILSVAIRRTLDALDTEFRDMPLPMDARQLEHVDRALRLLVAVADFNRRLIREGVDRSPPLFGENPLPGHLSRFLHAALEIMGLCHLSHRQLPERFWLDTHQAGLTLIESGLAGKPDPAHPAATLRDIYLTLLLEATADPYHLSESERIWTVEIIARYGALVRLEPAGDVPGGVFGIRADQDKPPYPLAWQSDTVPDCDLVLNTAPLVRKLALIVSQLERGRPLPQGVPVIRHPGDKDLLQRLKLTWGGSMQRFSARHRPAQTSLRIAIVGFQPIHRHLADAAGLAGESDVSQCQLVNESPGGTALQVMRPAFRLKIGSLVLVGKERGDGRRDLGLVHWFKMAGDGTLTFGIKYLHGHIRPSFWALPGGELASPCLLIEAGKGRTRTVQSVIMPAQGVDPQAGLQVVQEGERLDIKLDGKIKALPEVDVFSCEPEAGDD
ncbi:MAG: hypothetical protein PHR30_04110 [Gallionellaceae bacterium]|nr:hypothetical protein [Gallionellaceae bacterium]MDD5364500.1 hypothetical protein [Gallionellaceae bacterium]